MKLGTAGVNGGQRVAAGGSGERAVRLDPGSPLASGGSAAQNVNLTEIGGPTEVGIPGVGTLSNPLETR